MTAPRRTAARGFTVIELMIVAVVLVVVTAVAAPGMRSFVVAQRVKAVAHDLTTDLMLARSEALKRSATAQLAAGAGGLLAGWTVSAGNTVLGWRGATAAGVTLEGAPEIIAFNSNGRVTAPVAGVRITVRSAEPGGGDVRRCVSLDLSGRVSSQVGACP